MLKNLDLELDDFGPPSSRGSELERPSVEPRTASADTEPKAIPPRTEPKVLPPRTEPKVLPTRTEPKKVVPPRIQELHRELLAAKQKANDPSTISEKALAESVRVAEEKLRKKHGDKAIDFAVVVKNGKALLKPIIR
jgi:hypothetical protein